MENPIVKLSECVQRQHGKSITTRLVSKKGQDHTPTITCEIELPDGRIFQGVGSNKKIAKQEAAKKALIHYGY